MTSAGFRPQTFVTIMSMESGRTFAGIGVNQSSAGGSVLTGR